MTLFERLGAVGIAFAVTVMLVIPLAVWLAGAFKLHA